MADYELWDYLAKLKIDCKYFAIRWVMVLMCQEMEMPDCIRLWDTLLADKQRFDFLEYISCQAILLQKKNIMAGDFAKVMEYTQDACKKITDVPLVIR